MALFNKLFFSSSNKRKTLNSNQPQQYLSQFPFDTNQVRILLYRECDSRGRRLLFDSNAVKRMDLKEECPDEEKVSPKLGGSKKGKASPTEGFNTYIEISDGVAYKHSRPSTADITSIGEMVFGALAMSFRGTALKVHWLQSPSRVLCSQVFLSPIRTNVFTNQNSGGNLRSIQSVNDHSSTDNMSMNSFSMPFSVCVNRNLSQLGNTNPLDMPISELTSESGQDCPTFDSGYSGTDPWTFSSSSCYQYSTRSSLGSVFSDCDSYRKLSIDSSVAGDHPSTTSIKSSNGSLQRRVSRNISTSFENQNSTSDFIGFIGDNCQTATNGGSDGCVIRYRQNTEPNESRSNPEMVRRRGTSGDVAVHMNGHGKHISRRAKLGLAVCITMTEPYQKEMEQFCCEHIALLESMLSRLRASAENAYINHRHFLQIMLHAWQNTAQWVVDLFSAPRLPCPIWLNISSCGNKNSKSVADSFIKELCWLLSFADTKDTNFFISTMLTAILTHHLGWVSTVAELNSTSKTHIAEAATDQKEKLLGVSQKHPYNALWAQMSDLYGAIGNPPKLSRTIIYGSERCTVEKILNILTYFIRCGEVQKTTKVEVFDKTILDSAISKQVESAKSKKEEPKMKSGLTRTRTCVKDLGTINKEKQETKEFSSLTNEEFTGHVMNEITSVYPVQDSHLIHQEFTIGNLLMNPGVVEKFNQTKEYKHCPLKDKIRLTLTTPENIEVPVDSNTSNIESVDEIDAVEAIEIEHNPKPCAGKNIKEYIIPKKYFWNIEPIKEGLSWEDLERLQSGIRNINYKFEQSATLQKSSSISAMDKLKETPKLSNGDYKIQTSLSDLITTKKAEQKDRLKWGIETIKEGGCLENEKNLRKQMMENSKGFTNENGVVFVLGDNEALVNIKKSNEDIVNIKNGSVNVTNRKTCKHHKKHSGVKFNFEQYPQIATNYMKNKNLHLSNYDFLQKSSKFENILNNGPSTSTFPISLPKNDDSACEECEMCSGANILQTPSNATELEFETDDNYSPSSASLEQTKQKVQKPRASNLVEPIVLSGGGPEQEMLPKINIKNGGFENIFEIPTPGVVNKDDQNKSTRKFGFIPSLFSGISDHYISDMVLQGTTSPPQKWEFNLKQDLALSSRCASLISNPSENVAVVADIEKWDVKLVSSQTHVLPFTSAATGRVGMSQMVATMLETVCAMNASGISSYECLSYMESKLYEMYLQSEALAAFLLATEFCSLSTVTSALNLSANDVPLLLSVASIHSPQVTKKYGVSFR